MNTGLKYFSQSDFDKCNPPCKLEEMDEKLIKQAFSIYGIPKILLRNSIPVTEVEKYADDYNLMKVNFKKDLKSYWIERKKKLGSMDKQF